MEPFEYPDMYSGRLEISPFPVLVDSLHREFLGAGVILGQIYVDETETPVIELEDRRNLSGKVYLLGHECNFFMPTPDKVEEVSKLRIFSAYTYARRLDAMSWIDLD